ncbi:dehydrogenase [Metarhizobium album]|uniref:Dehydrogenase n=1 Tax=Metarhizobium album TaxID=2182425 RepID=A0A2U2DJR1_9HYPH|nr:alcohol dehydrogenase catalytic domain-containing protein [Rhizobium album]PWE53491.1 dehydrogenase [Rhizobium album]
MKAVRLYAAGDLRVEDIEAPGAPREGMVRLTVTAAGICGSDLHNFRTGQWISRSPSVAGHEFAGVIDAVGAGVAGLSAGDAVVADSRYWCGTCPACRDGRRNVCATLGFVGEVCDGGFAEAVELPARLVVRCDAAMDPTVAAMGEPLSVALHAIRRLRPEKGRPVLVAGCGPIGGLVAVLLSKLHDGRLLIADRNGERAARVAAVTGGAVVGLDKPALEAALGDTALLYAIEATGNIKVVEALADLITPGGAIALVGISHGKLDFDPNLLVEREIALIGCHAFGDELPEVLEMLPALTPALKELIDEVIDLDAVPAAYARLLAGQASGLKTIIRM